MAQSLYRELRDHRRIARLSLLKIYKKGVMTEDIIVRLQELNSGLGQMHKHYAFSFSILNILIICFPSDCIDQMKLSAPDSSAPASIVKSPIGY